MRKLLLIVLLGNMLFANAQDKVILRDGTELNVKVIESNESDIIFVFPNEEVRNRKAKNLVDYILYASGRKEVCQHIVVPSIKGWMDWEKVIVTTNRDDVAGLQLQQSVSVSAGLGGAHDKADRAHASAINKLKKKVAGMLCGIVLITSDNFGGRYNNISSITGEVYKHISSEHNKGHQVLIIPNINDEKDWEKVVLTTNRDDVAGLQLQQSISVSAGNGGMFNSAEKAHEKAIIKLKKKVAKMRCGVVLITSDDLFGTYDNISQIKGEVYK